MTRPWQNSFFISFTQGRILAVIRGVNSGTSMGFSRGPLTGSTCFGWEEAVLFLHQSSTEKGRSRPPGSLTVWGGHLLRVIYIWLPAFSSQSCASASKFVYGRHWCAVSLVARAERFVCYEVTATRLIFSQACFPSKAGMSICVFIRTSYSWFTR